MAQPKIFVPGPSVSPNIGTPAQYLSNINRVAENLRNERLKTQQLEQDRLFQQQQNDLANRKQIFLEGAPDRERAELEYQREQESQRALAALDVAQNAPFAFADTFMQNPETQKIFASLGITDPEAQRSKILDYAKQNPNLFRDPTQYYNKVYRGVLENKGTREEAKAEATEAVGRIFRTLDPSIVSKLLDTGSTGAATLFGKLFSGGSGGGSSKFPQGLPNLKDQEEFIDVLQGRMNIEKARGGGVVDTIADIFNIGDSTRSTFDFFDRDLDRGDVQRYIAAYGGEYPHYAIVGALRSVLADPDDGTISQEVHNNILNNPDSQDARDFRTAISQWQANAERRGMGNQLSSLGADEVLGLVAAMEGRRNSYNSDLISRTSPQAASFADRLSGFRNYIGAPAAAAAQQGPVINPNRAQNQPQPAEQPQPGGTSTGSAALDGLINQAPAGNPNARAPGNDNRLFRVNESVPEAAVKAPFRLFNQAAENLFEVSGAQDLTQRVLDNTVGETNLKPTGIRPENEIVDQLGTEFGQWNSTKTEASEPKKAEVINTAVGDILETWDSSSASKKRSSTLWDITGTGPARENWQKRYVNTPAKAKAYSKAFSQNVSETEAVRIIRALQRGETPKVD